MKNVITINEIAEASGVSTATVSRVINGKNNVNQDTRRYVQEIISKLEEDRGISVQFTKKKNAPIILLAIDFDSPILNDFSSGVQKVALYNDFRVVAVDYTKHRSDFINEVDFLSKSISLAGIVMMNSYESESAIQALRSRLPIVIAYRDNAYENVSSVSVDNDLSSQLIANHLLSQGCRNIVILSVPHGFSRMRRDAVIRTFDQAGYTIPECNTIQLPSLDLETAASLLHQYLETHEAPDAVFAINDLLAAAAVREIRKTGLRVPQDVLVAGFDNSEISTLIEPNITTIDVRPYNVGALAANLLIETLRDPSRQTQNIVLQGDLIVRDSTSPLRTGSLG